MLYIKLIAEKMDVSLEVAEEIMDNMYLPKGFSNSSDRQIIKAAKEAYEMLG